MRNELRIFAECNEFSCPCALSKLRSKQTHQIFFPYFFMTYILDYAYLKYNYNVIFVYLKSHLIAAVISGLQ